MHDVKSDFKSSEREDTDLDKNMTKSLILIRSQVLQVTTKDEIFGSHRYAKSHKSELSCWWIQIEANQIRHLSTQDEKKIHPPSAWFRIYTEKRKSSQLTLSSWLNTLFQEKRKELRFERIGIGRPKPNVHFFDSWDGPRKRGCLFCSGELSSRWFWLSTGQRYLQFLLLNRFTKIGYFVGSKVFGACISIGSARARSIYFQHPPSVLQLGKRKITTYEPFSRNQQRDLESDSFKISNILRQARTRLTHEIGFTSNALARVFSNEEKKMETIVLRRERSMTKNGR